LQEIFSSAEFSLSFGQKIPPQKILTHKHRAFSVLQVSKNLFASELLKTEDTGMTRSVS